MATHKMDVRGISTRWGASPHLSIHNEAEVSVRLPYSEVGG